MRGWSFVAGAAVVACNGTARRPSGEGEPRGGSSDGVADMNAGTLQVVATHDGVPADAVVWTERGHSQHEQHWLGAIARHQLTES